MALAKELFPVDEWPSIAIIIFVVERFNVFVAKNFYKCTIFFVPLLTKYRINLFKG